MSEVYDIRASWGNIEFDSVSIRGDYRRRITQQEGIYNDGGTTEDLGRNSIITTIETKINADAFKNLVNKIKEKKYNYFIHPLLGNFMARLNIIDYNAHTNKLVDVTIEVIEHSFPKASNKDIKEYNKQKMISTHNDIINLIDDDLEQFKNDGIFDDDLPTTLFDD